MIRTVTDVPAMADAFLEGLNACFPGWGGKTKFDWCFRREAGGPPADLLVAEEEGSLLAGSAVLYRRAWRPGAEEAELVGCITGSWTLPAARQRGLFKGMIEATRRRAAARGCRVFVGFGRRGNVSSKALAAAGATIIDTAYLTAPAAGGPPAGSPIEVDEAVDAFERRAPDRSMGRLLYAPGEWRSQFIDRPNPVRAIRTEAGVAALIEEGATTDHLLDVATADPQVFAEAAAALAGGPRPLVAYTADPAAIALLRARGFGDKPGCLYLLATDGGKLPREPWWAANGDRM